MSLATIFSQNDVVFIWSVNNETSHTSNVGLFVIPHFQGPSISVSLLAYNQGKYLCYYLFLMFFVIKSKIFCMNKLVLARMFLYFCTYCNFLPYFMLNCLYVLVTRL